MLGKGCRGHPDKYSTLRQAAYTFGKTQVTRMSWKMAILNLGEASEYFDPQLRQEDVQSSPQEVFVSILVITHCCAISVSFYDEVVAPRWYSLDFDLDLLLKSIRPLHVKHRCGLRPFRVCTKQLTMSGWKLTCAFLLAIDVKVIVTLLFPHLNFPVWEVIVNYTCTLPNLIWPRVWLGIISISVSSYLYQVTYKNKIAYGTRLPYILNN